MMSKIAIYGAGSFGKLFFIALNKKIDFFIDDFSTAKTFSNIKILKINNVAKNTKIYISVLQHSTTIKQNLQKNGFLNIITFTDSIKIIPNILHEIAKTNYLWLVEEKSRMINVKKLQQVEKLLSDKASKNLFLQIIQLRKTLDTEYYIDPKGIEYFPQDIPILENLDKVNFIDCGAYIGDTIEELMKQVKNVNMTISFEPDLRNLSFLKKELDKQKQSFPQTSFLVYPSGVYSSNSILKFTNTGINSSASLNETSSVEIPVVTLDSTILNASPNFIKMDIEGAEKEALIGATKTIQRYKPNLAICLYHKPEDLWELPLLVHKIESSYDMYIRVHEDMCLSTVLYCISRKRDV